MLKTLTIAELINFKTYLRETTLGIFFLLFQIRGFVPLVSRLESFTLFRVYGLS